MSAAKSPALYEGVIARRSTSAKFLVAPGPSEAQIGRILAAAARAPDHGRLVPFRLVIIEDAARGRFADVLEAAARDMDAGVAPAEIERAREKAHQGPCLIGLIGRIDPAHPKIGASDQWLTVGCVLENLLLAVEAEGQSAAVRSGGYLDTAAVRAAFGLGATEHFTCFLAIGTATEFPPAKPKPAVEAIVTRWRG